MDRSRADDILREWSIVARTARRPSIPPRPHLTRSALPAGLLVGGALVIAIMVGFGIMSRGPQNAASGSPSASPTPSPTPSAATQTAGVVARVDNCLLQWNPAVDVPVFAVSGRTMYMVCYASAHAPTIVSLDLDTNKVLSTYTPTGVDYVTTVAVVNGQLWYGAWENYPCQAPCRRVGRIDLASGKETLAIEQTMFLGYADGSLWVAQGIEPTMMQMIDPETGETGKLSTAIPFAYTDLRFACGSFWGLRVDNPGQATVSTAIVRIDSATRQAVATFAEPGVIRSIEQIGDSCWATVRSVGLSSQSPSDYPDRFVLVGQSGIEQRSPIYDRVALLAGAFWLVGTDHQDGTDPTYATGHTLQRIDPVTWQPTGAIWDLPGKDPTIGADGSIWADDLSDPIIYRLDIPVLAKPAPPPTPEPSSPAGVPGKAARVVASLNCQYEGPYAVSADRLAAYCYVGEQQDLVVVDLATNKVVAAYEAPMEIMDLVVLTEDGLWYSGTYGSCTILAPCPGFAAYRIDFATGKVTMLDGWGLDGYSDGVLWAHQSGGKLAKLDPKTGAVKGWIPFEYPALQIACGSLWGISTTDGSLPDGTTTTASTTLTRIDPSSGKVLASFTEPGAIGAPQQVGGECWAPAYTYSPIDQHTSGDLFDHFVRIGQSGIEFRTDKLAPGEAAVALLGGTYWLIDHFTYSDWYLGEPVNRTFAILQRIDPATWQPTGQVWNWAGSDPQLAAGGSLWASNERGDALVRLDIPTSTP
jgi:hypothetical protein